MIYRTRMHRWANDENGDGDGKGRGRVSRAITLSNDQTVKPITTIFSSGKWANNCDYGICMPDNHSVQEEIEN